MNTMEIKVSETHKIIVGNGNQEDKENSISGQVTFIKTRQNTVIERLDKFEPKLDGLLSEITNIHGSLATFKASMNGKEVAEKRAREKSQNNWYRGLTILGLVIVMGIAIWNHFTGKKNIKETIATKDTIRTEIRLQEGISKTTRGGYVRYNDNGLSDSIKIR